MNLKLDVLQQALHVLFRPRHIFQSHNLLERVRQSSTRVTFQEVKITLVVIAVPALEHDLDSVGAGMIKLVVGARSLQREVTYCTGTVLRVYLDNPRSLVDLLVLVLEQGLRYRAKSVFARLLSFRIVSEQLICQVRCLLQR